MNVEVKQADPESAGVIAQLLHSFNAEFDTPAPALEVLTQRFDALLQVDQVIVVLAKLEENPVGFAYLTLRPSPYYEGPIALLEELHVVPELRGQGIGTAMLAKVHELLGQRACGEIQINVDEVDVDARRFYERHGFSNFEAGQDYRMLCYIKEL